MRGEGKYFNGMNFDACGHFLALLQLQRQLGHLEKPFFYDLQLLTARKWVRVKDQKGAEHLSEHKGAIVGETRTFQSYRQLLDGRGGQPQRGTNDPCKRIRLVV
jgi:hypothetical protein